MPIYEYRCDHCGHCFEKLIRSDGDTPTNCPACEREDLRKLFSSFSPAVNQPSSPCENGGCPSMNSGACSGGACPF